EPAVRALRQLLAGNVHADLLELELVELARQAEVLPRLRQHLAADEAQVILELPVQRRHRLLGAGDPVFGEELVDAVDEELRGIEIVLHFDPAGRQEPLAEALARLGLGELHHRTVSLLDAGVLAHAPAPARPTPRPDPRPHPPPPPPPHPPPPLPVPPPAPP